MITLADIDRFIKENKSKLNAESLIIVVNGGKFAFLRRDCGYLNIKYDWVHKINGEVVFKEMAEDAVAGTWSLTSGLLSSNDSEKNDDLHRVRYNMNDDEEFMTVSEYKKSFYPKMNQEALVSNVGLSNDAPYMTVDSLKIIETPTLDYSDSWGHKKHIEYKYNCIALVLGEEIVRTFEPVRESFVFGFDNFKENKKGNI